MGSSSCPSLVGGRPKGASVGPTRKGEEAEVGVADGEGVVPQGVSLGGASDGRLSFDVLQSSGSLGGLYVLGVLFTLIFVLIFVFVFFI